MRLPALLLLLAGCGPLGVNPSQAKATIINSYAESLFTLTVTPVSSKAKTTTLFSGERINSNKSATSASFTVPTAAEGKVDFVLTATSLGDDHRFTGQVDLTASDELLLTYDYDLALAEFRATYKAR